MSVVMKMTIRKTETTVTNNNNNHRIDEIPDVKIESKRRTQRKSMCETTLSK